jgi:hypothetical protein
MEIPFKSNLINNKAPANERSNSYIQSIHLVMTLSKHSLIDRQSKLGNPHFKIDNRTSIPSLDTHFYLQRKGKGQDLHASINTSMKISEVIYSEHSRTCQIQQEAVVPVQSIQTQHPTRKVAQIQRNKKTPQVSTHPIPDQIKHKLVQDRLTKQLMRQSNIVKPTTDDIQIARDRVATELKRSDLEYQKKLELALRS